MTKKQTPGKKAGNATIALNKKARFDYSIETQYEAGLVLEGWEVKSLRSGKAQITESYVILKKGEAWLLGAYITPLGTVSTHFEPDPTRTRKLLLHAKELSQLIGAVEREGYTLVPLKLYWKRQHAKLAIGLAKGKKKHEKRETIKKRDWQIEKQRVMKKYTK